MSDTQDNGDGSGASIGQVTASYTAIAEVSEALLTALRSAVSDREDVFNVPVSAVELISPDEVASDADVRLGLSLYGVTENAAMKNADRTRLDETRFSDPPLALDLQYLLTAYPAGRSADETAGTLDQQRMLGLAMQVFNDLGALEVADGELTPQVSVAAASTESLTALWSTFGGVPYRPSVAYHVGPVVIPSREETVVPQVNERRAEIDRRKP